MRYLGTSIAAMALAATADSACAQTALPEVTVTAPSPVAAPPKPRPIPVQTKRAGQAPTPASSPQSPAEPQPAALLPPPGTVVVDAYTFAAVSVMNAAEIEAKPTATLAEALSSRPGIATSSFAAGASRPIIRGLDNTRRPHSGERDRHRRRLDAVRGPCGADRSLLRRPCRGGAWPRDAAIRQSGDRRRGGGRKQPDSPRSCRPRA